MKKILIGLLVILCVSSVVFAGCGEKTTEVIFNLNNGKEAIVKQVEDGEVELLLEEEIEAPNSYVEFSDWYVNSRLTKKYNPEKNYGKTLNLYAKWKLKSNFFVVTNISSAMSPTFNINEKIVFNVNETNYQVGDIIAFKPTEDSLFFSRISRILDNDGVLTYKTKGDANPAEDYWTFSASQIEGVYVDVLDSKLSYLASK